MNPLIVVLGPIGRGGLETVQEAFLKVLRMAAPTAIVRGIVLPRRRPGMFRTLVAFGLSENMSAEIEKATLLILQTVYLPEYFPITLLAKKRGIPFVILPRGNLIPTPNGYPNLRNAAIKSLMWNLTVRRMFARSIGVVTTSQLELSRLTAAGASAPRWRIIPDPLPSIVDISSDAFASFRGRPFALYLGRLAAEKNLAFAVRMWPRVLQAVPNAELKIVGSDDHPEIRVELNRAIRELQIEHAVSLLPWVEKDTKAALIQASRCIMLPSHFESFGLTVVEALQYQTPVLTSTGTPWAHLPPSAGFSLPLEEGRWTAKLVHFLASEQKIRVPLQVVTAALDPFQPGNVARAWEGFLREAAPQLY